MRVILFDATDITMTRPGRPLFEKFSFSMNTGDRIGIVGLNGCGKSTLLSVLSGRIQPERGSVRFGRGVRIARLDQQPELVGDSVRDAAGGTWESDAVLDRLGMGPHLDTALSELSGGQQKRTALAQAVVAESDLLILDEPTNHLDIDAIAWLEARLGTYAGGLLLVTHDRHFLDNLTNRIIEIDRGAVYVHDGGYQGYLEARARREEAAVKAESVRRNLAKTELAWLRRGAPARTSKPKARIATATAIVEGRAQSAARTGDLPLHFDTPRLGDIVLELDDVSYGYAPDTAVLEHVTMSLDPRERLGLVGVNGAGKTTLIELLAGRVAPWSGSITVGQTVQLGYFDQNGQVLDPEQRVRDAVAGPHRSPDHRDAALMEAFWFDDDVQFAPIRLLSGGERRRLQLLMVLAAKPNVLLLDEPTNDLDIDTLRALEDFCEDWPGALVVVSHDRAFLERTVADVVVVADGVVERRPGGYGAYEQSRRSLRRQRGSIAERSDTPRASQARAEVPTPRDAGPPGMTPPATPQRTSMSPSTIRHRLREIERTQAELQQRRDDLVAQLGDMSLDVGQRTIAATELATVESDLASADEQWIELAEQAELRGLEL